MTANFDQLFTKLENWQFQQFNSQANVDDIADCAYVINFNNIPQTTDVNLEEFHALLQVPQIERLQALVCQINWQNNIAFGIVLEALCDMREAIPNLKALFIGDVQQHEYRKSKLAVFDIRPILEAYPNLQVLHTRGSFCEYKLECESLKHERLKTLIVETADLDNQNLAQICALELPNLEYLELWLGRQLSSNVIDTLTPILFGESFPKLSYLGLRSSEYTNLIVETLVQSPILERLIALDLSMGMMTDEGLTYLLNCPTVNQLHTLNISMNYIYDTASVSQLRCQVIAQPQDSDYGDRYSALHE